jgi:DNA-binding LytR/AlgR family response regulator
MREVRTIMKIRIEMDEKMNEKEIVIRCKRLDGEVEKILETLSSITGDLERFPVFKEDREYYLDPEDILFFETGETNLIVHTAEHIYYTDYKLYELEELLPGHFIRASKSAILNINKIYSVSRNLSSSSIVEFQNSHKRVYVSRHYYRPLRDKLEEKRKKI